MASVFFDAQAGAFMEIANIGIGDTWFDASGKLLLLFI
jgi:hypothetical protein